MSVNEQLARWHHDSAWLWLQLRLQTEYRSEFARAAIRQSKLPQPSIRIDAELKRLLGFK